MNNFNIWYQLFTVKVCS